MVNKPSTVDEALAYVWALPDTALRLSQKQDIAAALAERTDAVARRYFSSPDPEHWVGTLKQLLKPAGILPSSEAFGYFWKTHHGDVCASAYSKFCQSAMQPNIQSHAYIVGRFVLHIFTLHVRSQALSTTSTVSVCIDDNC